MKLEQARRYALSLPEVHEEPHHDFSSFRIGAGGRIFATVPPDGQHLHILVDEEHREPLVVSEPATYEKLWWGKKVLGVRVNLAKAKTTTVNELLVAAWRNKAPKRLVTAFDAVARAGL